MRFLELTRPKAYLHKRAAAAPKEKEKKEREREISGGMWRNHAQWEMKNSMY